MAAYRYCLRALTERIAMTAKKRPAGIESLLSEILGIAESASLRSRELKGLVEQFDEIASRDYRKQLRNHFSPAEIGGLVAVMKMNIPELNQKTFRNTEIGWLRAMAQRLGAELNTARFSGDQRDLRGFYVPSSTTRSRSVIWLNTAHHRVAVAATFWHEIGHHLLEQLGERSEPFTLSYSDDYKAHMSDVSELVADILLVLAVYPKAVAARLFGRDIKVDRSPTATQLAICARDYLRSIAGWEFEKHFLEVGNLHYLAGMIHYAKLRWALLAEYRI